MDPKRVLIFLLFGIPALIIAVGLVMIAGLIGGGITLLLSRFVLDSFLMSSVFGGLAAAAAFLLFRHHLFKLGEAFSGKKGPAQSNAGTTGSYANPLWTAAAYCFSTIAGANLAHSAMPGALQIIIACGVFTMLSFVVLVRFKRFFAVRTD